MLNSKETRNLIQDYDDGHVVRVAATLIKCAAALAMIGGVALFGVEGDLSGEAPATLQAQRPLDASLARHMEHHQRFASSDVASGVIVPAARANPPVADAWDRRDE